MPEEDENIVNRIFSAVGLEKLDVTANMTQDNTSTVLETAKISTTELTNDSTNFQTASSSANVAQAEDDVSNAFMLSEDSLINGDTNGFTNPASFSDLSLLSWDDNLSPDWPWMGMFVSEVDFQQDAMNGALDFMADTANGLGRSRRNSQGPTAGADSDVDDEVNPELIGQIAARVGALHLAPDGKLRYFGTPANTYLFNSSGSSVASSKPRSLTWEGRRLLRNADLDQPIDNDLEEHFLGLFFSWYNSCHAVVDGPMFSNARKQWQDSEENNGFYSDVLLNAIRSSFSLGRPFTLDASELNVSRPRAASPASQTQWSPFPTTADPSKDGYSQTRPMPDLVDAICEQRIALLDTVEPIARALIEYHYLQILVHRPWTSRRVQPIPAQGRGFPHARKICIESACAMAQILRIFEKDWGYQRLDVETSQLLPSAALILIFASVSGRGGEHRVKEVLPDLTTLFRALDELSTIFSNARQHLDSLVAIQQQWRLVYNQQYGKRREDGSISRDEPGNISKRSRLA
ncbi:hypothetical protein PRZ48_015285 [Zasmidium cellare]|uniref:Transcription factor domain-containing protein n=1 Tax=Zasmidium cellare TaxID=395010 RepID=A0ABR0DXF0_ZASCE|nr:hypothetical protein PRZ48_015285 [Zasmidium cellare]